MGLFNFVKSKGQRKTEKKTKRTQNVIRSTKARVKAINMGKTGGKLSPSERNLAAEDIARFPQPKRSKPRTQNLSAFGGGKNQRKLNKVIGR